MVGSAIHQELINNGYTNILMKTKAELDLRDQKAVEDLFINERPEYVLLIAAKVGGILANDTYRADFIYDNLSIQINIIHAAHKHDVKKLLFMGSACIYPKFANQPITEDQLLNGKLEYTNEPYAIAKIAGIKLCENYYKQYGSNFISIMPNNLYGPNDNFDLKTSHVLPALIRKMHEAKINNIDRVEVWGTGNPLREFLYVDDLAKASLLVMQKLNGEVLYDKMDISHINVGSGDEISIKSLALLIKKIVGYQGALSFNREKDGTPRKLLDITRISNLGWTRKVTLKNGIETTYEWYKKFH
jgi:GDP-L-fucose synthase